MDLDDLLDDLEDNKHEKVSYKPTQIWIISFN
mgnify:CR=1 FL=1